MDDLYHRLIEYPSAPLSGAQDTVTDGEIIKLIKILNNTAGNKLLGTLKGGRSLLEALQLPIHTLPYLYTLLAHIQASNGLAPGSLLWNKAQDFVFTFDPIQVRYSGHEFRRLLEAIAQGAEAAKNSSAAAMLIQQALLRLDPTTSTFTSLHLLFVKLCLRSRAYNEALRILDNDIYHIAPSKSRSAERQQRPLCSQKNASPTFITQEAGFSTTIEYRHHLLYHLYGAMLYIGAKNWERALLFLEIVMSCPTPNTASMIQVEAYKKWVLVCLLQHGKVLSIPRGASSAATKNYRSLSKPYEAIGEAFKNTEQQKLRAEATAGENIWQQDCNLGLIFQVLLAHQRFAILSLSKIYTSIPLSTLYSLAFPPSFTVAQSYDYIANLITTQQLNATLHTTTDDPANAVLRFTASKPSSATLNGADIDKTPELLDQIARIDSLNARMCESRHRMEITKHYADALSKSRKAEAESKHAGNNAIGNGMDWAGRDEELLDSI